MPIINSINMQFELDQYVLEHLISIRASTPIAVNVTHDFITQSASFQLISSLSKYWKDKNLEIIFELPNKVITSDPEASKAFSAHIRKEGWKLGIDHFTVGEYDIQLLEILQPSYLKINAAYLLSLIENEDKRRSKSTLLLLSELLEIDLIAIAVDSEDTVKRLKENGIEYMQGFWISEPQEDVQNV